MTTYIPAVISGTSESRIKAHADTATVTKAALRKAVADALPIEFISKSHFHRYGSWFTGAEAVAVYGPVGVEVRSPSGALIAVIEYAAHPSFGEEPVRAEVTGRVQ